MEKIVKIRLCDLCASEDNKDVPAVMQYSDPDLLDGFWFDACKDHAKQMKDVGTYRFRRIPKAVDSES